MMSIVGTVLGGALIYMLLGQIADLIFNCAYFMVSDVLLAKGYGLLTNFNFLLETNTLYEGLGINSGVVSGLLNLIYLFAWVVLVIVSSVAIIKLLANQTKNTSGAVIKVGLRIIITALFLSQWYPMLRQLLAWTTNLLSGALYRDSGTISMNDLITALETYADGTNLIAWNSFMQNPGNYVLECILAFSLGSSLIACVITYIERYVAFAFYIFLSPLSVALAANEETSDNLKTWISGLFPQIASMIVSILLLAFGIMALNNGGAQHSAADVCFKCAVGMVFFGLSRNTEKLFGTLGFRVSHVGDAAKSALAGTATAMSAIGYGKNVGGKLGQGFAQTETGKNLSKDIASAASGVAHSAGQKLGSIGKNKVNPAGLSVGANEKPLLDRPNGKKVMLRADDRERLESMGLGYKDTPADNIQKAFNEPSVAACAQAGIEIEPLAKEGQFTESDYADTPEDKKRYEVHRAPLRYAKENGFSPYDKYENYNFDNYAGVEPSAVDAINQTTSTPEVTPQATQPTPSVSNMEQVNTPTPQADKNTREVQNIQEIMKRIKSAEEAKANDVLKETSKNNL